MKEQQNTENASVTANVKYKSSVFSKLFGDPAIFRELYSAIENVELPPDTKMEINTLSNTLILGKLNDVSFLLEDRLIILVEHQSTINENMPFRMLEYIDRCYKGIVDKNATHQRKLVKIPRPEFIVLYNGKDPYDDHKELRLSDAFKDTEGLREAGKPDIFLELIVQVYNINHGHNKDILEKSKTLDDYSIFVKMIREYEDKGIELEEAIKLTVKYCIDNKILEEFLRKHGAEVIEMLMEEYSLENAILAERKAAAEEEREKWQPVVAEKETIISQQETIISEKDTIISDKDTVISEQNTLIEELKARLAATGRR